MPSVDAIAAAGAFPRFWLDAVTFWCDVEPILRAGYDRVLSELGPRARSIATSSQNVRWPSSGIWPASLSAFLRHTTAFGQRPTHPMP